MSLLCGVKLVLLRIVVPVEHYPKSVKVLSARQSDGISFPDEIGFIHCPKRCAERYPIHQRTNFVGLFGHDITQCVLVINYQFDFIKDFEVLAGPFRSTQQKTYMIEGQNKQDESIIYTYILQANKVGTFVIPPATITANGSLITSNSVQIKVQFAPPTVTSENVRDDKEENVADNSIYETVEQMPEYPSGGTAGLMNFISKNLKYPTICQESGVQGRVVVSFVVNKDGSTTDFRIIRSVDKYLDKEALRVLNGMPKWKPGKQKGVPVRVRYTVPINFKLS